MALIEATGSGLRISDNAFQRLLLSLKPTERTSYKLHFGTNGVPANKYKSLVGVAFEEFEVLLSYVNPKIKQSNNRGPRKALAMFLMK